MTAIESLSSVFASSFMQPEIIECDYFAVETEQGTDFVHHECMRLPFTINFAAGGQFNEDSDGFALLQRAFAPYVEGNEITEIAPRHGFLARLSASGYMDCTDYTPCDTEEEAAQHLIDQYGDDET